MEKCLLLLYHLTLRQIDFCDFLFAVESTCSVDFAILWNFVARTSARTSADVSTYHRYICVCSPNRSYIAKYLYCARSIVLLLLYFQEFPKVHSLPIRNFMNSRWRRFWCWFEVLKRKKKKRKRNKPEKRY